MKRKFWSETVLKIAALALAFTFAQVGLVAETVHIPDPDLESTLREILEKPTGNITIADMESLTEIFNTDPDIHILTGLERATNLTFLYLTGNAITDIGPLAGLSNLTELHLSFNMISDISPLAGLTSLTELHISDNQISDIGPLASLTNLAVFSLDGNRISDISPLAKLTNLRNRFVGDTLNLEENYIDISPGSPARQIIDDLNARANLTISFEPQKIRVYLTGEFPDPELERVIREALGKPEGDITAADMESLTELSAWFSGISDLTGLERATNLTYLDLGYNKISDISPLGGLTSLTQLGLGSNEIRDISPVAGLTNLIQFHPPDNMIRDISPLAGLTKLIALSLERNHISDISPLVGLTNLLDRGWNAAVNLEFNYIDITPGSPSRQIIDNLNAIERLTVTFEPQNDPEPLIGGIPIAGQEDWCRSDWFGVYCTTFVPWLYHAEHGFLYRDPSSPNGNMYFYDDAMGKWWWTNEDVYPFVYRFSDGVWLWYLEESSSPRWCFNFGSGSWEEL